MTLSPEQIHLIDTVQSALAFINSENRDSWITVGMAIKSEFGDSGFSLWDDWSKAATNYNQKDSLIVWNSFKQNGVTIGSLFFEAKQNGWHADTKFKPQLVTKNTILLPLDQSYVTKSRAERVWSLATPAPENHPYLVQKNIKPLEIRVLGCLYIDAPYSVGNDRNLLIIPMIDNDKTIWSIQFINESGKKAYLRGTRKKGAYYWVNGNTDIVYLCEGFATGATIHQQTGNAVACAFDAHSLIHVDKELVKLFNNKQIIIMADDDWQSPQNTGIHAANKAAQAIGAQVRIPYFSALPRTDKDSDYNDYCRLKGNHHG